MIKVSEREREFLKNKRKTLDFIDWMDVATH